MRELEITIQMLLKLKSVSEKNGVSSKINTLLINKTQKYWKILKKL